MIAYDNLMNAWEREERETDGQTDRDRDRVTDTANESERNNLHNAFNVTRFIFLKMQRFKKPFKNGYAWTSFST